MIEIIILLLAIIIILLFLYRRALHQTEKIRFSKQSLSSRYGKMTEQFMPFLKDYPYDPQNFRFLGTPVDGVQFNDDGIVFVEFKSSDSRLSARQKKAKNLIEKGRVGFREIRIR